MPDVGVYLVGAYMEFCCGCDVVSYDHALVGEQGDIDVLGLDLANHRAFVAEAKIHLSGMGGYGGQPGPKVREQIIRGKSFLDRVLPDWSHEYSVWSPHVTPSILSQVSRALDGPGVPPVELIFNETFAARLNELTRLAARDNRFQTNAGFRLLQVLARSTRHGFRLDQRTISGRFDPTTVVTLRRPSAPE
jgi:hypothetical protein